MIKFKNIVSRFKAVFAKKGVKQAVVGSVLVAGAFASDIVFAQNNAQSLSQIASNVEGSLSSVARLLEDISLVAGIGFIMASFFKLYQHKNNPTQIPISNGLTMLGIGALTLFPALIPTAATSIIGSQGTMAKLGGSQISQVIGGQGQ